MQNSENNFAKKVLQEMGPYLNKTKLAAICDCHPNTIENYIKGKWSDQKLGYKISNQAVAQFLKLKEKINSIETTSPIK